MDNTLIAVALGKGNDFLIDYDGYMAFGRTSEPGSRVYLGKATVENLDRVIGHMNALRIHMKGGENDQTRG